ncbi:MAG: Rab family GTPase [Promethearchaeota archaeon]
MFKEQAYRYIFKICLIGAGGVGKTCICRRYCLNTFNLDTKLTIGIDFYTHDIPFIIDGDKSSIRLTIWDFGGQEHFKSLFPYYVNGVNGIFLVFDLLQMQSLINLDWWYDRLKEYHIVDLPKIVIGTKLDLINEENKQFSIDELTIEEFLNNHGERDFIKTSAAENINIKDIFKEMVKKVLDYRNLEYERIL